MTVPMRQDVPELTMASGAVHDTQRIAAQSRAEMIVVRSRDGPAIPSPSYRCSRTVSPATRSWSLSSAGWRTRVNG